MCRRSPVTDEKAASRRTAGRLALRAGILGGTLCGLAGLAVAAIKLLGR